MGIDLTDFELDDVVNELKHYGVKGMKWGQRKASDDGGGSETAPPTRRQARKEARQKNRDLNKQSERANAARIIEKSKAEPNAVEAARMRVYSGANNTRLSEAREKYKTEKTELGSVEAKRNLDRVKRDLDDDYKKAQEPKDAAEFVNRLLDSMANVAPNEFARDAEMYRIYRNV